MSKITLICRPDEGESSGLDYGKFLLTYGKGTPYEGAVLPETQTFIKALALIELGSSICGECHLVQTKNGYGVALHRCYPFWDQDAEVRISDNFLLYAWHDALGVARSAELKNAEILLVEYNSYFSDGGHDLFAIYPVDTPVDEFVEAANKFHSLVDFAKW